MVELKRPVLKIGSNSRAILIPLEICKAFGVDVGSEVTVIFPDQPSPAAVGGASPRSRRR